MVFRYEGFPARQLPKHLLRALREAGVAVIQQDPQVSREADRWLRQWPDNVEVRHTADGQYTWLWLRQFTNKAKWGDKTVSLNTSSRAGKLRYKVLPGAGERGEERLLDTDEHEDALRSLEAYVEAKMADTLDAWHEQHPPPAGYTEPRATLYDQLMDAGNKRQRTEPDAPEANLSMPTARPRRQMQPRAPARNIGRYDTDSEQGSEPETDNSMDDFIVPDDAPLEEAWGNDSELEDHEDEPRAPRRRRRQQAVSSDEETAASTTTSGDAASSAEESGSDGDKAASPEPEEPVLRTPAQPQRKQLKRLRKGRGASPKAAAPAQSSSTGPACSSSADEAAQGSLIGRFTCPKCHKVSQIVCAPPARYRTRGRASRAAPKLACVRGCKVELSLVAA